MRGSRDPRHLKGVPALTHTHAHPYTHSLSWNRSQPIPRELSPLPACRRQAAFEWNPRHVVAESCSDPPKKTPPYTFASLPFIIFHFAADAAATPAAAVAALPLDSVAADELSQHLQIFLLSFAPSLCWVSSATFYIYYLASNPPLTQPFCGVFGLMKTSEGPSSLVRQWPHD